MAKKNINLQQLFYFLILEAIVYVVVLYKSLEFSLLILDKVISGFWYYLFIILGFALILVLNVIYSKLLNLKLIKYLIIEIFFLAIIFYFPNHLYLVPPSKGMTSVWLPLEWHKLYKNFILMSQITPSFFLGGVIAFVVFNWQIINNKKKYLNLTLLGFSLAVTYTLFFITKKKAGIYFVAFNLPILFCLLAAKFSFYRMFARTYLVSFLGFMIFGHYTGLLPLYAKNDLKNLKGVEKIYPLNKKPDFPLIFMREFYVDINKKFLFTSYGPASGVIKINLQNGKAEVLEIEGLVRYLYSQENINKLYALDWDVGDFLVFQKYPFALINKINILTPKLIAPWDFAFYKNKMYVTFHEYASLVEYQLSPFKKLRTIDFKEKKFTKFTGGGLRCLIDEKNKKIFAEIGMIDLSNKFLLLKVDLKNFKVEKKATIPEGGLALLFLKNKKSILTTSFFSNKFYEFNSQTLKLKRTFKGPLNCRNIVYDKKRDYLYATSFLGGEFYVLGYSNGKVIKKVKVGKKAESLFFDNKNDVVYLGSSVGIYKINLKEFLKN